MQDKQITTDHPYTKTYDLDNCEVEPIHIIQTVQSFACLISVGPEENAPVVQASTNVADFLEVAHEELLGKSIFNFIPAEIADRLKKGIRSDNFSEINPLVLPRRAHLKERFLTIHRTNDQLCIEIEYTVKDENDLYFLTKVDHAIQQIQSSSISKNLFDRAAEEIKKITGYNRVMIYQFDADYNGQVVAEVKEEHQEAFFEIRYPATDIPKQARDLFLKNRVRMLTDVEDELSLIKPTLHPTKKVPLNVTNAAARGSSPIHLEYLRNMGVKATLTVAIVEDDKLWGLIACHHEQKKVLDYRSRSLIKFMGNIISGHLSLQRAAEYRENILKNNIVHAQLFEQMNREKDIIRGLTEGEKKLTDFIASNGSVVILDKKMVRIGDTPTRLQVQRLVDWLAQDMDRNVFATNHLLKEQTEFIDFAKDYSGILAVKLSGNSEYIIWFRRSQEQEVIWGGDPHKSMTRSEKTGRLSPRKSFAKWKEVVANKSVLWTEQDTDAALKLRNDIKDILLKRFSQLKKLHEDLSQSYTELESFSYTVSHDLRSPLRGIEGFAQILVEDYSEKLDDFGVEVVNTIVGSVHKMNGFINDILQLSKLAKKELTPEKINVNTLVEDITKDYLHLPDINDKIDIRIEDCPPMRGDQTTIRQVFSNLINNAIKYRRPADDAYIIIGGEDKDQQVSYFIKDNGIGFEMKHADKIFDVFSRLVSEEEYEGSGIGLAIVKRVVDRHKGNISVKSESGEGTIFRITFPK